MSQSQVSLSLDCFPGNIHQGTRWIIDYNTGTHLGADPTVFIDKEQQCYQGQLERYAALMGGLEQRPLRFGLYFPCSRPGANGSPPGGGELRPDLDNRVPCVA